MNRQVLLFPTSSATSVLLDLLGFTCVFRAPREVQVTRVHPTQRDKLGLPGNSRGWDKCQGTIVLGLGQKGRYRLGL